MTGPEPSPLGLKRSFGFGDRLGLAGPGHADAVRGTPFLPVFAQQSVRELERTCRSPADVMEAAVRTVREEKWPTPWGADADHLKTGEDVRLMAAAGYTLFTIDPSGFVNDGADTLPEEKLAEACLLAERSTDASTGETLDFYLEKEFDIGEEEPLVFQDREILLRAFLKYGGALAHTRRMARWIEAACAGRPFEVELSVDETATPTSPLEHLFIALELERLGVKVVSLAPRFTGAFEKGVDYRGDPAVFERHYALHAAVARTRGPYKLSIHSGSDKFGIYPVIGRLSGELLHVKTAGTSYLEALRVVCRTDPSLFREIAAFCRGRYDADRRSYHVSARLDDVPEHPAPEDLEARYLDDDAGRQILHVTYGSVLGGTKGGRPEPAAAASGALPAGNTQGAPPRGSGAEGEGGSGSFRERIMENLEAHEALYRELLAEHLGRHIRLLLAG